MNKKYSELAELFRSEKTDEEILDFLLNYHKNDIADMMAGMTEEERKRLYHLLGAQKVAEIFKYIEEPRKYIRELSVESAARVISEMDSDDAVDCWKIWIRKRKNRSSGCWTRMQKKM